MSDIREKLGNVLESMKPELEAARDEIRFIICQGIENLKERDPEIDMVLNDVSSRIKGKDSFKEKLSRKGYVTTWGVHLDSTDEECKDVIRKKLKDLIGFRINCYFEKDEKRIYSAFRDYMSEIPNVRKIKDCGDGGKKIADNYVIYKISYAYTNPETGISYGFEVQIKCLTHNLWGEVDHEIAYKSQYYDYDFPVKKDTMMRIRSALQVSESHLYSLFKSKYTKENMINSLFFLFTKERVSSEMNGKNPTRVYQDFFRILGHNNICIKEFVAKCILEDPNQRYEKKEVNRTYNCNEVAFFSENVVKRYFKEYLDDVGAIAKQLFNIGDIDSLCIWFGCNIMRQVSLPSSSSESENPSFNPEQEQEEQEDDQQYFSEKVYYKKQNEIKTAICVELNSSGKNDWKPRVCEAIDRLCEVLFGGK